MELIVTLTLPFFAVVGLGYLAGRRKLIPEAGVGHLNVFVFYFAMPALVIGALARQPLSVLLDSDFLVAWLVAGLAIFLIGALLARFLFGGRLGDMAIFGQACSVGNLGFLALPLMLAAFGKTAAGPVAAALVVDLVVFIPLSIALLEAARRSGSVLSVMRQAFVGAVANPFLISIAVGVLLSATEIGLPGPLGTFAAFLGGAAGPAALFSLGLTLAGRRVEGALGGIAAMTLVKLFVHPLAAWLALTAFGLPPATVALGTVVAAMPVAGNVFVIAQQYGVAPRRSSAAILVSTVVAVVTVALALAWAQERIAAAGN